MPTPGGEGDDAKRVAPSERLAASAAELEFAVPVAIEQAAQAAMLAPEAPLPAATPEHFVCLRGPCRHYFQIRTLAGVQLRGVEHIPTQVSRYCTAISGVQLDLTEDLVFECSRWEPQKAAAAPELEQRAWLAEHPECQKADDDRNEARRKFYGISSGK